MISIAQDEPHPLAFLQKMIRTLARQPDKWPWYVDMDADGRKELADLVDDYGALVDLALRRRLSIVEYTTASR